MKHLSVFSKKYIIAISTIIFTAGALIFGLSAICISAGGPGPGPGVHGCGQQGPVKSSSSYVNIPILNNHYPKTVSITKVYLAVPAIPCYEETDHLGHGTGYCFSASETRVKQLKFGDTVTYSHINGYCCCIGSPHHSDGYTHNNDTDYTFSGAKVLCRISLDKITAPSGNYIVTFFYTIEGDSTERSNQLTFTIP